MEFPGPPASLDVEMTEREMTFGIAAAASKMTIRKSPRRGACVCVGGLPCDLIQFDGWDELESLALHCAAPPPPPPPR